MFSLRVILISFFEQPFLTKFKTEFVWIRNCTVNLRIYKWQRTFVKRFIAFNDVPSYFPRYTNRVVTLWYRPPELLLGDREYGPSVDLWGFGCIMAEMWTRCPILQGNSEQTQLMLISQLCGSITPEEWPKVKRLRLYNNLELAKGLPRNVRITKRPLFSLCLKRRVFVFSKFQVKNRLGRYICDPLGCDLLNKLLVINPEKRIDADSALNHDFFWSDPMPRNLSRILSLLPSNNFEYLLPRRFAQPVKSVKRPPLSLGNQNALCSLYLTSTNTAKSSN